MCVFVEGGLKKSRPKLFEKMKPQRKMSCQITALACSTAWHTLQIVFGIYMHKHKTCDKLLTEFETFYRVCKPAKSKRETSPLSLRLMQIFALYFHAQLIHKSLRVCLLCVCASVWMWAWKVNGEMCWHSPLPHAGHRRGKAELGGRLDEVASVSTNSLPAFGGAPWPIVWFNMTMCALLVAVVLHCVCVCECVLCLYLYM